MRIKISNETGKGVDTKIILIDDRGSDIEEIDISSCFYDAQVRLPVNSNIDAVLWVDDPELDEQGYEQADQDDFDPSQDVSADQSLEFPTDI